MGKGVKPASQSSGSSLGKRKDFGGPQTHRYDRDEPAGQRPPRFNRQTTKNFFPIRTCGICGKLHAGICYKATGGCYNYDRIGHFVRDCTRAHRPMPRTTPEESVQGSVSRGSSIISRGRGRSGDNTLGNPSTMDQPEQRSTLDRVYTMHRGEEAETSDIVVVEKESLEYMPMALESNQTKQVENIIHVNGGDGIHSYARNSSLQRLVLKRVRPILEDTVKAFYDKSLSQKFAIVDMGCSSGPNALQAISIMINSIFTLCKEKGHNSPELLVFLNDLPGNDFNSVFRSLPQFYEKLKEQKGLDLGTCFISGVPGTFYGRLFPSEALNFVHSSSSLHWLSQVPEGIENNKGNIYMSETSPKNVFEAYLDQFQRDFSLFLSCRAMELKANGQMILTLLGRSSFDPICNDCVQFWYLLTKSLLEMSREGLIEKDNVDSFNLPWYTPFSREVIEIIEMESSFEINNMKTFGMNWDPNDNDENQDYVFDKSTSGENVASCVRAALESLLASHFGEATIDELFSRYARNVGEYLSKEKTKYNFLVISMTKKS
ncbi:probable jasmonic acid carboxyl methyltransferase 2 [Hevea brasiliensis]|uniref:probable jasmonic acid carboxyl methyltransferase 2 n=1 Tax=Hevea brasiliensis TaxID=3981 RepID=UPI0025DBCFA6|nr:probable jasmonic acid carboxyl methyltransferase 2 [Hevea brasiliensis]